MEDKYEEGMIKGKEDMTKLLERNRSKGKRKMNM
jgi:hypothetical protein